MTANLIMIVSGILWTFAYLIIIYMGFKDKTYGMPVLACALNLSWEFYYSFVAPFDAPQVYVNIVWFFLDLIILSQIIVFIRKDYPGRGSSLYILILVDVLMSYLLISYADRFEIVTISTAFEQNFLMSILFIAMLLRRKNLLGQSVYVALFKFTGTALIAVLLYFINQAYRDLSSMTFLYLGIGLVDVIYLMLLLNHSKQRGINPWKRA